MASELRVGECGRQLDERERVAFRELEKPPPDTRGRAERARRRRAVRRPPADANPGARGAAVAGTRRRAARRLRAASRRAIGSPRQPAGDEQKSCAYDGSSTHWRSSTMTSTGRRAASLAEDAERRDADTRERSTTAVAPPRARAHVAAPAAWGAGSASSSCSAAREELGEHGEREIDVQIRGQRRGGRSSFRGGARRRRRGASSCPSPARR